MVEGIMPTTGGDAAFCGGVETQKRGRDHVAESNKGADNLNQEMNALRDDLKKVQNDLRELGQTIVDTGRDSAREQWESGNEQFQKYVQERPLHVVLGAFIAGLVAGMIFRR